MSVAGPLADLVGADAVRSSAPAPSKLNSGRGLEEAGVNDAFVLGGFDHCRSTFGDGSDRVAVSGAFDGADAPPASRFIKATVAPMPAAKAAAAA